MADQDAGRFTGRVAVVPGSSANPSIGRSCAVRLGREGASLVINGRDASTLAATERDLRELGIDVVAVLGSLNIIAAELDR